MTLIGVREQEGLIHAVQITLDLVIGGTDDRLKPNWRISEMQEATFSASIFEKASSRITRWIAGDSCSLGDRLIR